MSQIYPVVVWDPPLENVAFVNPFVGECGHWEQWEMGLVVSQLSSILCWTHLPCFYFFQLSEASIFLTDPRDPRKAPTHIKIVVHCPSMGLHSPKQWFSIEAIQLSRGIFVVKCIGECYWNLVVGNQKRLIYCHVWKIICKNIS